MWINPFCEWLSCPIEALCLPPTATLIRQFSNELILAHIFLFREFKSTKAIDELLFQRRFTRASEPVSRVKKINLFWIPPKIIFALFPQILYMYKIMTQSIDIHRKISIRWIFIFPKTFIGKKLTRRRAAATFSLQTALNSDGHPLVLDRFFLNFSTLTDNHGQWF